MSSNEPHQEPDSLDSDSQDVPSSSTESHKRQKSSDPASPSTSLCTSQGANVSSSSSSASNDRNAYNAMIGSVAASPPRFVAMEEIMKAASGVANMYLAHEIAVDENFTIPVKQSSGAKSKIEEIMKKAYWDILQSQLNDTPPVFKQAVALLSEMKELILSFLLPQHTRLKQEIDEILDLELIQQQAENGTLDFARYGQYVLSVMARLCAPVRDESIRQLTQTTDVVSLFRGMMELLDLMKLDWANFSITAIRPHLQQQSIEYERMKFKEYLETQSKIALISADPLLFTRTWLERNYKSLDLSDMNDGEVEEANDKNIINRVLSASYTELLKWNDRLQDLPPETLLMDFTRFLAFRDKVSIFTLTGSIILVTFSSVGPDVQQLSEFKQTLKQHLFLILGDAGSETSCKLEAASLQVCKEVTEALETHGFPAMNESSKSLLQSQIRGLGDENNRIRKVLERRILEFIEGVSVCMSPTPVQIPSGLSVFSEELLSLTGQFMRLVNHNRAVFGEYYASIIADLRRKQ